MGNRTRTTFLVLALGFVSLGAGLAGELCPGTRQSTPVGDWGVDSFWMAGDSCAHETAVEVSTASDGALGVAAAYQLGRCPGAGCSKIGWRVSSDNGFRSVQGSFSTLDVASLFPSTLTLTTASDPVITWSPLRSEWLLTWIPVYQNSARGGLEGAGIVVSRIRPDGTVAGHTVVSDPATTPTGDPTPDIDRTFFDKQWIECDRNVVGGMGYCYMFWTGRYVRNTVVWNLMVSRSTSGGLDWTVPATAGPDHSTGAQIVVTEYLGTSGRVIVPYWKNDNLLFNPEFFTIGFVHSDDHGQSWQAGTSLLGSAALSPGTLNRTGSPEYLRTFHLPSAAGDAYGNAYVFWEDCRFRDGMNNRCYPDEAAAMKDRQTGPYNRFTANDIVFLTTTDGDTLGAVRPVPLPEAGNRRSFQKSHFLPGVSADRHVGKFESSCPAALALAYYTVENNVTGTTRCTPTDGGPADCRIVPYLVQSLDGAASWSEPVAIWEPMKLPWLAPTGAGRMLGDYTSSAMTPLYVHTATSVAERTTASPTTYHQKVLAGCPILR